MLDSYELTYRANQERYWVRSIRRSCL